MAEVGRRGYYDENFCPAVAGRMAALGATEEEIAEGLGVSPSTLASWKRQHPEFAQDLKLGKLCADAAVEDALYRRAIGYDVVETRTTYRRVKGHGRQDAPRVRVQVVKTQRHVPPNLRAVTFWLENRKPEEWYYPAKREADPGDGGPTRIMLLGGPPAESKQPPSS